MDTTSGGAQASGDQRNTVAQWSARHKRLLHCEAAIAAGALVLCFCRARGRSL